MLFHQLPEEIRVRAEAHAFRSLVAHLQARPQVQNMELMTVSGFCRNCLSKWLLAALREMAPLPIQEAFTYDDAMCHVYNMPYGEWKAQFQSKAEPEQLERYQASKPLHATHPAQALVPIEPAEEEAVQPDPCCPINTAPVPAAPPTLAAGAPMSAIQSALSGWSRVPPPAPPEGTTIRAGVLTISDRASQGAYKDVSGPRVVQRLTEFVQRFPQIQLELVDTKVVPDEEEQIVSALQDWTRTATIGDLGARPSSSPKCNLVLTTGGTGCAPRDVTPEATARVVHKVLRGLTTLLVMETSKVQPLACLSRGTAGIANGAVVLNLPGSPAGVDQYLEVALPLLPFAVLDASSSSTTTGQR